ncbi:hypothetical protein BDW71DRAFT_181868 [Aspergillus fruticulosus]
MVWAHIIPGMIDNRPGVKRIWTTATLLSDLGLNPSNEQHFFQHQQRHLVQDPERKESSCREGVLV